MSLAQLEQVLLWLTLVAALGIVSIIAFYFWYLNCQIKCNTYNLFYESGLA